MKCIYVNWSQPFLNKEKLRGHGFKIFKNFESSDYVKPDYEILYTILSVSNWKKFNGPTKLYTDNIGKAYYEKIGILDLWDEVDTETLENFNKLGVDGGIFWTSAKTYCICNEPPGFVFSDLDFIVREKMPSWFYATNISIAQWEIGRGYYYPSENELNSLDYWKPFPGFKHNMMIPNTSLLYINDEDVQKMYWNRHWDIVKIKEEVPEWMWLLSDQGVFGQTLRTLGIKTSTLTDKVFLSENEGWNRRGIGWADTWFYSVDADKTKDEINWEHIWLAKVVFSFNEQFKKDTCKRFNAEIKKHFPKYYNLTKNMYYEF